MALEVHPVPYGVPAEQRFLSVLSGIQREDVFTQITVVAPSVRVAAQLRHRAARAAAAAGRYGIVNVRYTVLAVAAAAIAAPVLAQENRRALDRSVLGAALKQEIGHAANFLAGIVTHPSTEYELVRLYEEMRYLSQDDLQGLAECGRRERELVVMFRNVRERLAPLTYDDVDLFATASTVVRQSAPSQIETGTLLVHLPQNLRSPEAAFLAAAATHNDVVVLLGQLQPGADGAVDVEFAAQHRILNAAATNEHVGATWKQSDEITMSTQQIFDEHVVASDQRGEVREVTEAVARYIASGGRPENVGIAYTVPHPYLGLVTESLSAIGIPSSSPSTLTLRASGAGQFLSTLLGASAASLSRSTLLQLLATGVVDRNALPVPIGEWDRCSRLAGIVHGDNDRWHRALRTLRSDKSAETARLEAGNGAADIAAEKGSTHRRRDRAARTVAACTSLDRFLTDLFDVLTTLATATTWSELAFCAKRAMHQFLPPPAPLQASGRSDVESIRDVLDELGGIDDLNVPVDQEAFLQALNAPLDRPASAHGRAGSGVVVGNLASFVGVTCDRLFVLGCIEGQLPGSERTSPLVAASDRDNVGLESTTRRAIVQRDEHRLRVARAGCNVCVATSPETNGTHGRAQVVSRFVDNEIPVRHARSDTQYLEAIADRELDATALGVARSAAILRAQDGGADIRALAFIDLESDIAAGVAVIASREGFRFDRFSGHVALSPVGDRLFNETFSPTTLESYAACPFKYFVQHELGCEVVNVPEQRLSIDPRDRGTIVHEILELCVLEELGRSDDADSGERDPQMVRDAKGPLSAQRVAEIAASVLERNERLGITGRPALWELERRQILASLETERQLDAARRQAIGARPIAAEYEFGIGDGAPVVITTTDGALQFRGKVDRVDAVGEDGVCVIDYKTGRVDEFRGLKDDPVDRGKHLQLPIYAHAAAQAPSMHAEAISAVYRFVGKDTDVAFAMNGASTERFTQVLDTVVGSIRNGLFPLRPGAATFGGHENCRQCDFSAMCPADRERRWEQLRVHRAVQPYAHLAEGPLDPLDAIEALPS